MDSAAVGRDRITVNVHGQSKAIVKAIVTNPSYGRAFNTTLPPMTVIIAFHIFDVFFGTGKSVFLKFDSLEEDDQGLDDLFERLAGSETETIREELKTAPEVPVFELSKQALGELVTNSEKSSCRPLVARCRWNLS